MATINFYLKKPGKTGTCPVLLTYQANGSKFRSIAKVKVAAGNWNLKKQRLKEKSSQDIFDNKHLDFLESKIKEAERESLFRFNELNFGFIKEKFENLTNKESNPKDEFFEVYNLCMESFKNTFSIGRIKHYTTLKNHLLEFSAKKKTKISFEGMTLSFHSKFLNYMLHDCKMINNTATHYIKALKAFLAYAKERGYDIRTDDFKKFKTVVNETEITYLTEAELMTLYNLQFLPERLRAIRDNFLFACFTGLRYSDMAKLRPENIKGDYIEVRVLKTKDTLKIPFNRYSKEIIRRNNGFLPPVPCNQKMNLYLKELATIAGIDSDVQTVKYTGIERIETITPKFNLITTHTARRTFVTLSLEKGMRPETVMSITGHKDYKTFKKYIKLTDNVKMMEMNKIWEN